jgi:hypothetical protein
VSEQRVMQRIVPRDLLPPGAAHQPVVAHGVTWPVAGGAGALKVVGGEAKPDLYRCNKLCCPEMDVPQGIAGDLNWGPWVPRRNSLGDRLGQGKSLEVPLGIAGRGRDGCAGQTTQRTVHSADSTSADSSRQTWHYFC